MSILSIKFSGRRWLHTAAALWLGAVVSLFVVSLRWHVTIGDSDFGEVEARGGVLQVLTLQSLINSGYFSGSGQLMSGYTIDDTETWQVNLQAFNLTASVDGEDNAEVGCRAFPLWYAAVPPLLLWAVTGFRAIAFCRSHRRRKGLCPNCAYDLRATPRGLPCPECGTHPSPPIHHPPTNTPNPAPAAPAENR